MLNGVSPDIAAPHELRSCELFDRLSHAIARRGGGADIVQRIGGVICFRVRASGPSGTSGGTSGEDRFGIWVVDLKHGAGSVMFDPRGDGDVTFSVADEDLMRMAEGELDPKWATVRGKLKISGDYSLAMTCLHELKAIDFRNKHA
jgi:hypothetical protein